MERLTYNFAVGENHCWQVHGADNLLCEEVCNQYAEKGCKECPIGKAIDRLAHYEDLEEQGRVVEIAEWEDYSEIIDNTVCGRVEVKYKRCSNCKQPMGLSGDKHCGNCGAKMNLIRHEAEAALAASGKEG